MINQIPLEKVWEVHLAGGNEQDGYRLDSHSAGIDERLSEVAKYVVARLPNLQAIIFEIFPSYLPVSRLLLFDAEHISNHKI